MKLQKVKVLLMCATVGITSTMTTTYVFAETETEKVTIETLQSENDELKSRIEILESENAQLKDELSDTSSETETETETDMVETEITGVEYTDISTVKIVQEALNKKGFDCGTPDGISGSKTVEAIKKYEQQEKINVNGVITDELLEKLNVADKIDEAAKKEAMKAEYSSDYSYEQLARNPDSHIGDKVIFTGKVLQAETGDTNYLRLAVDSNYDTILFVTYSSEVIDYRLLENDYITIYGTSYSTYSYEAVSGATITLPWIWADIIEMQ